ncbi:putative UBC5-E2 ubiquitin-conjugating enzyme [Mrakia frigida]|uniref:ubiquitin-conjugating enzyme E2 n=1 Tax=Mrakia frigida TaxID=29902 RepID=UPI003FCC1C4B
MSGTSVRRIQKELGDILKATDLEGITVETADENILLWTAFLAGPPSSPYKGGTFKLSITFPPEYPFKAPIIKFMTKIYHPNVDDEGNICVGLLKADAWKPAVKMSQVLMSIYNLLSEPNPDDPLVSTIAEQFRTDRKKYDATAKDYVKKYAS